MGAHCLNSRTPLSDPPRREDITVLCVLGSPILNANRKVILKPKELDGVVAVNVDELLGHVCRPRPFLGTSRNERHEAMPNYIMLFVLAWGQT